MGVFKNPRTGKPYRDRKKFMKRLCHEAKVHYFRFHSPRHSGASVMDQARVPTGSIQRVLGHRNRRTTEIYLHSMEGGELAAIEAFEQARKSLHRKTLTQSLTQASQTDLEQEA
jgi:integrase